MSVLTLELEAKSLSCCLHSPVGHRCYGNAYNRKSQVRSKRAGIFTQNNLVPYLYTHSNPRSNTAPCASCREQVQMGLYQTAGLKSHHRAAVCLHQKLRCIRYLLPKKWCLEEQKHRKHNRRQTEQDLTEKGLGIRCQSRSSSTCWDSISMRKEWHTSDYSLHTPYPSSAISSNPT